QAEDGIRDFHVTGVQTCALPISDFDKRNTKLIGLSCDSVDDHQAWSKDIEETQGHPVNYPIIDGSDLSVAKAYDVIHPNASGDEIGRASCRERGESTEGAVSITK